MSDELTKEDVLSSSRPSILDTRINAAVLIFLVLIILAVLSRFYAVGERVMSHDETTHVYFSWLLSEGQGYQHDPLSHGPFQFHLIALSYFLFGDTDASARFPAALFGVIAVGLVWVFKRWLGVRGAIVAGIMMLISPYMLYYSRYARNEALVVPLAMLTVWAIFRYMQSREPKWLYLLAFVSSLHFATKETAFIFTAQILLFLVIYFVVRVIQRPWPSQGQRTMFIAGAASFGIGVLWGLRQYFQERTYEVGVVPNGAEAVESNAEVLAASGLSGTILIAAAVAIIGLLLIVASLIMSYGKRVRTEFPALDLLIILITMVLPQLAALPATIFGWNPLEYQDPFAWNRTLVTVIGLALVSAAIGLIWNWRKWLIAAAMFWAPFIVLYTTLFTNGQGLASGLVGSLGYWLVQQGVERGSQPQFYYALIQLPIYEFLPSIGAIIAGIISLRAIFSRRNAKTVAAEDDASGTSMPVIFLGYWGLSSLLAYSLAGERMPWITVHIALPLILLAGWGIGKILDAIDWQQLRERRGWLVAGLILLFVLALLRAISSLLGPDPPFKGNELEQLSATLNFLATLAVLGMVTVGLYQWARNWSFRNLARLAGILVLALLTLITIRSSARAAYVNYDEATEFLVYAHMARGPKTIMEQIEELSERITGHEDLKIAYDNESTYPFWWYFRNYTQVLFYGSSPSRDLLNYPVVVAGDANWSKLDPLLGDNFFTFDYTRIWWPNQDYHQWSKNSIESQRAAELMEQGQENPPPMSTLEHLSRFWGHIRPYLFEVESRKAAWDIWFDRDFTAYGDIKGIDYALANWNPSSKIRLYIRKDIATMVWDYGIVEAGFELTEVTDPYEDELESMAVDRAFGRTGTASGEFTQPRGMAIAADGSIYIADTMNHRIQHVSADGEVLNVWGQFGSLDQGNAPGGTFNEPWGVGVAPDGSVYVADTWNHRIQHFTAEGEFVDMFGSFGQADTPTAFWGPRDVAVDSNGRIFVSDTGNKRIVVFDELGAVGEFGGFGLESGYFDEPVGITIDDLDRIYVADTWNQRIQVFEEQEEDVGDFSSIMQWPIVGWYGQSLNNKPYLAVAPGGNVCTTDPEGPRVLCFSETGEFVMGWSNAVEIGTFLGNPSGIAFDAACGAWITDSSSGIFMRFQLDICSAEDR
jgi:uncharacterized protein (TIGR03663 family)